MTSPLRSFDPFKADLIFQKSKKEKLTFLRRAGWYRCKQVDPGEEHYHYGDHDWTIKADEYGYTIDEALIREICARERRRKAT